MRILLTGGSGFIGRNLRESWAGTHDVVAPGHRELELTDSVQVQRFLAQGRFDAVIHSATTPGHRNAAVVPDLASRNIRMFLNFAQHTDLYGRMVYLSSGAIYDTRDPIVRAREDDYKTRLPEDSHGFSKHVIARLLEGHANIYELRLFGVFGKYEDYAIRFISNAICKALYGLPITLRQNRRFDYVPVSDLATVIDRFLLSATPGSSYNVTSDETVELLALAHMVRDLGGHADVVVAQPGLGPEYSGDNSRLKQVLGKLPFPPMQAAVRDLFHWYRDHLHFVDKAQLLNDK